MVARKFLEQEISIPEPKFYTISDASKVLHCCPAHIYNLFKANILTPVRVGRKTLIPISQIDDLIAREIKKTEEAAAKAGATAAA